MNRSKIQNVIKLFFLAAFVSLIVGCPYESNVPINQANMKFPDKLMGKWMTSSSSENENPTFYVLTAKDDYYFNIEKHEYSSSDSAYSQTNYTSHMSDVDGTNYLNIREDGKDKYMLYKLVWQSSAEFLLYEVTDNIQEEFNASKSLKEFVAKYQEKSFFFNSSPDRYLKQSE